MADADRDQAPLPRIRRYLPEPGSLRYHLMLGAVALFILGPLGGITSAYMFFSLGFAVGGQVLAGILGSSVTFGYGPEGKHGANYMQTMAASVASMSGMCVLIQAMVWLGMPMPETWKLVLYFGCIGMFGIGVGMLYTPILVDRLQLEFPSGHAVANILRALTDPKLLRRSIGKLGGGTAGGIGIAAIVARIPRLEHLGLSAATVGAGLIVGSRITVPAVVMGGLGYLLMPALREAGWLGAKDPFRKIGFLIALAMIVGAAVVDLTLIGIEAVRRLRRSAARGRRGPGGGLSTRPARPLGRGLGRGADAGRDAAAGPAARLGAVRARPGFPVRVHQRDLVRYLGLEPDLQRVRGVGDVDVGAGVAFAGDRDDRGQHPARLVPDRRRHAAGSFDRLAARIQPGDPVPLPGRWRADGRDPVRRVRQAVHERLPGPARRYVLAPRNGGRCLAVGDDLQVRRRHSRARSTARVQTRRAGHRLFDRLFDRGRAQAAGPIGALQAFVAPGARGFMVGWVVDAILLASPYATSFGGFVDLSTSIWFGIGGLLTSALARRPPTTKRPPEETGDQLPEDMSTSSLVGGGLIAGESLYTLAAGIVALLALIGR